MDGKITYHQQVSYCGKPRCRKCREGIGHGPYWYAYKTVNGRTSRTYIGKKLPPHIQSQLEQQLLLNQSSPALAKSDFNHASLHIFTLGQLNIEYRSGQQWQIVTDATWQKQNRFRALLAFLCCSPGRKASREQIMKALWPKSDPEVAAQYLHKALQSLRRILTRPHMQDTLLQWDETSVSLAGQQHIWIDADAFEALLQQSDVLHQSKDSASFDVKRTGNGRTTDSYAEQVSILREAMKLYGGDFLPEGRQIPWVNARRQTLRRHWITLMLALAELYISHDPSAAIEVLNRLLAHDPTNEHAVQRLIVVLARLKRRGEALRVYHRLADVLEREYGTVPSEVTTALFEAVRQGQAAPGLVLPSSDMSVPAPEETGAGTKPLPEDVQMGSPIGRSHRQPLVGRSRELGALRQMLLDLEPEESMQSAGGQRSGGLPLDTLRRPQCVILMGEAGIGKTRLAEELSRMAQRRNWTIIWSRVYQQERGIPYRLWTEILRKAFSVRVGLHERLQSDNPLTALHMASNANLTVDTLQPLVTLLPEISQMFPQVQEREEPRYTPEQEQLRLWEAARAMLAALCEAFPLLIVLDDIQWADASSCELLGYLARHLYGYPIMFVATCRENELSERPPHPLRTLISHMQRERSITTLAVEPLTSEQIGTLVSRMSQLSEPMVEYIQSHAAGNPFFAEELARTTPPSLPKTISVALEHRVGRLSAACQQLLGDAAVLGGSFAFPLICAMEAGNPSFDEDTILDLLEEALQSGVLTEEGTGTQITYHFWHPLLVNHLYERISGIRRARLHLRAADVLQEVHRGHEEEVAATITHHLVKGDAEPLKVAHYARLAGDRAYALSAYEEAGVHYRLAMEQLDLAREEAKQSRGEQQEIAPLLYLLERLAECTMIRGSYEEARQLYQRVLLLRDQQSETDPQYEAQIQALVWCEMGWTWRYTVDSTRARECCERGEQVLRAAEVVEGPAWARIRHLQSSLYWQEGRYEEAQQMAQEALKLFEHQQELLVPQKGAKKTKRTTRIQRILEGDPVDLGRVHRLLGSLANSVGQRTKALEHLNTALALYERYDYKREIAHVSCDLGYIHLKKAAYEQAQASLRRALNLAERIGDEPLTSVIFSNLGELAASGGDLEEAERWYKEALVLSERINDREYISLWNAALATVLQSQGKNEEAIACIRRALVVGRTTHKNPCIGVALVALGNIRIAQSSAKNLSEPRTQTRLLRLASKNLHRALALQGLEAETRTRAQLALAHCLLLQGQAKEAHHMLRQVIDMARLYELTLLETQARGLLEQLSESV